VRLSIVVFSVSILFTSASSRAVAQTDAPALSPMDVAAACATPLASTRAQHTLRVVGVQDVVARHIFDERDLLVIDGGSRDGVQLNAQFFVRRNSQFGMGGMYGTTTETITDGWVRIVSLNETTAIARVERICGGAIFENDYLEPFAVPTLPVNADGGANARDPDFNELAKVVSGPDGHRTAAPGEFVTIDRGTEQRVQPGTEIAFYRDLTHAGTVIRAQAGVPLTAIGEAVVVSASGSRSLARIVRSRDAIQAGDYAVLRR
jgi:murein DD-endopeptidase MepM/ murein hydrolase activator NlpD